MTNELAPTSELRPRVTQADTDAALVATWLAQHEASPHTQRAYSALSARFLAALAIPLRSATLEDVRNAFAAVSAKDDGSPVSRATATQRLAAVKSLLTFGARVGYLPINLGLLLRLRPAPTDRARRLMSEASVWSMIGAAANERDALLIELAYFGGLRVSELVSLTWAHLVDREDGKAQIAGLVGKGGREREILLPSELAQRLRAFRRDAEAEAPIFPARASGRRQRPGNAMSAQAVWTIIKRVAMRSNLPAELKARISPHFLRHAHASHALDNGAPIQLVSETLGHASIKTTSIYAHAKPGDSSGLWLKPAR